MLRAVVTRGESEDRTLLTQAQAATRDLKPIRDEMATSNRVLRNGMLNLAIDMEQELGEQIQQLAQSLAQLNPSQTQDSASSTRQVAGEAQQLRQQIESLSQQAAEFNQRGETAADGNAPSLAQMREQLESSQALADSLSQQLAQQRGGSAQALRGDANAVGTARSIRQQLSRQDIEAFLAQPELLQALLQPIVELEGALRAQAELESAATQLYSADDEAIPDAYRELVEQYYRTLSEGDSGGVR
jgi:ABC-type transporter Mla subunit MlaD